MFHWVNQFVASTWLLGFSGSSRPMARNLDLSELAERAMYELSQVAPLDCTSTAPWTAFASRSSVNRSRFPDSSWLPAHDGAVGPIGAIGGSSQMCMCPSMIKLHRSFVLWFVCSDTEFRAYEVWPSSYEVGGGRCLASCQLQHLWRNCKLVAGGDMRCHAIG